MFGYYKDATLGMDLDEYANWKTQYHMQFLSLIVRELNKCMYFVLSKIQLVQNLQLSLKNFILAL